MSNENFEKRKGDERGCQRGFEEIGYSVVNQCVIFNFDEFQDSMILIIESIDSKKKEELSRLRDRLIPLIYILEGIDAVINPSVSRSFVRSSDELIQRGLLFYPSSPQLAITAPNRD